MRDKGIHFRILFVLVLILNLLIYVHTSTTSIHLLGAH